MDYSKKILGQIYFSNPFQNFKKMYVVSGYVVLLNNEHNDLKLRVPFGNCMAKQRLILYSLWYVGDGSMCHLFFKKNLKSLYRHLNPQKLLKITKGSVVKKCSNKM